MPITIKDIARMAGVSKSTVSRVINNSKPVKPELREKILKIMEEVHYRPNAMARGLAKNQSGLIGVIAPAITHTVFGEVVDGASKVAGLYGNDILLSLTEGDVEREIHYLNLHREKQVDGIILSSKLLREEHVKIIEQAKIPCVLVGQMSRVPNIPSVHVDNFSASYEAVKYLIHNGHRKIAMIRGPIGDQAAGDERLRGYMEAMQDSGLPIEEGWVTASGFSVHDGYEAMKRIFSANDNRPTALFAAADRIAIGAMNYLLEHGYQVPDDISIIGFDDIDMAAIVRPKLTTIHYSSHEIGMTAYRILRKLIKGETYSIQHSNVPHRLVIRDSVRKCDGD
jgi:LacI family transcriptional regulator